VGRRLVQARVPLARGYLALSVLVLLALFLWLVSQFHAESQKLAAIRADPNEGREYTRLQDFYWGIGWMRRSRTVFQRLADDPAYANIPWPLVRLAWLDYELNPRQALSPDGQRWADRALQMTHQDTSAWMELAVLYFNIGQYEHAAQAAQQAIASLPASNEPELSRAHFWAGQALREAGDLDAAVNEFELGASTEGTAEEYYGLLCQAALLTATRQITLTLHADYLVMETRAEIETPAAELQDMFTIGSPAFMPRYLAWGLAHLGPRGLWLSDSSPGTAVEFAPDRVVVSDTGKQIDYDQLWQNAYSPSDRRPGERAPKPELTIHALPILSNTLPTTVTILVTGTELADASPPYRTVADGIRWRLLGPAAAGKTLSARLNLSRFSQLKLVYGSNTHWDATTANLLWASSTVLGLLVLALARREAERARHSPGTPELSLRTLLRPPSLFSWIWEIGLLLAGFFTIFFPIWFAFQGYPLTYPMSNLGYLSVLVILGAWLVVSTWHPGPVSRQTTRMGAILFVCYLAAYLSYNTLGPIYLLIALLVYYVILIGDYSWSKNLDWPKVNSLFSKERPSLISKILKLEQVSELERALHNQDLALAKGEIKPKAYEKSQAILKPIVDKQKQDLATLREELGLPEKEAPSGVLLRLGPRATPLGNSLVALGFGLIPYLIFLALAAWSGDIWAYYKGGFDPLALLDLARDVVLNLPWGPVYLLFFGFFYRVLRGDQGTTKGLFFGMALAVLYALYAWLWQWDQVDVVELWGMVVRILVTFVFTGLMMDWMTVQFSLKRVRLLYDSPAFTTLITTVGTTATTLVVGVLTGTLSDLFAIAVKQISLSFGASFPAP
jgi:tetratricopeptide (TPR) repeat protein